MSVAPVPKTFKAEEAENFEDIEKQFAVKAVIHAQTYWSILECRPGTELRLTRFDDEIYAHLMSAFPEFDAAKPLDEDEMKNKEGKERWREFMMKYEKTVDDYNFGTLLRTEAAAEYEKDTTIFVPRMQFYAIEIARNRHGLNNWIKEKQDKEKAEKAAAAAAEKK